MAVNYTDFYKIWASASPLTPYSFTDANYTRGWDFVGSTPPSRQMWDAFMQNADEKLQYLYLHEDVPVGHEYFTFNPNVPQGSLPLFGGEYSRETYSALWAWVQEQTGYLKTDAEWQTLATANNGNVPYYSDGDGFTTFRVPSLKCYIKAANGTITEVGGYYAAGLPNITGNYNTRSMGTNAANLYSGWSGAFFSGSTANVGYSVDTGAADQQFSQNGFDASRSNSIYGNSNTVRPETVVGMWLVKAYGVIQDTGAINEQQYIDDRLTAVRDYVDSLVNPLTQIETGTITVLNGTLDASLSKLRKLGKWAQCDVNLTSATVTANTWTTLVKTSNGFTPPTEFDFVAINNSSGYGIQAKIKTSGEISVWSPQATNAIRFHVVFLTDN